MSTTITTTITETVGSTELATTYTASLTAGISVGALDVTLTHMTFSDGEHMPLAKEIGRIDIAAHSITSTATAELAEIARFGEAIAEQHDSIEAAVDSLVRFDRANREGEYDTRAEAGALA